MLKSLKFTKLFILFILLSTTLFTNVIGNPLKNTFIDTQYTSMQVVGGKIGEPGGYQYIKGWYTTTLLNYFNDKKMVAAWVRENVDGNKDGLYLIFMKFEDRDGSNDGDESITKIIREVTLWEDIISLDSMAVGEYNGKKYVLVTFTETEPDGDETDVWYALYDLDGNFIRKGAVASKEDVYEEYSRVAWIPSWNKFFVIWWNGSTHWVQGRSIDTNGNLENIIDITDTDYDNPMSYTEADQIQVVGGQNAFVVYRYKDSGGDIGLFARIVYSDGTVSSYITIYDTSFEEKIGVKSSYAIISDVGYFCVPFISGSYVGYTIVKESDRSVLRRTTYPGPGKHPYSIGLSDRFVLAWIDGNGYVKVGNIDSTNWYIHITTVSDDDDNDANHPLVAYDSTNSKYILVWTGYDSSSDDNDDMNVRMALLSKKDPTSRPTVDTGYPVTLVDKSGVQKVHGLAVKDKDEYIIAYVDERGSGKENIIAYVEIPDYDEVDSIEMFFNPKPTSTDKDISDYIDRLKELIDSASTSVYVAVAFFRENNPGGEGTLSKALKDAYDKDRDVKIIIDNDTGNIDIYRYFKENNVPIINDTSAGENHIMHDKFVIIDDSILAVSTTNFIPEDYENNNNVAIIVKSKSLAYYYKQEFLQIWNNGNGKFGTDKTEDHSFISKIKYGDRIIIFEGYFSPFKEYYGDLHRIPNYIAGYINRSTSEVYFASYIFSTSGWVKPIINSLKNVSDFSTDIVLRGVFDEIMNLDSQGKAIYDLLEYFDNKGVLAVDIHDGKMHDKLFVIDQEIAILGSYNPTKSATVNHDENILIIKDSGGNIAKKYRDHINTMYSDVNKYAKCDSTWTSPHLVINEVLFKPSTGGTEWIEIYNPTSVSIDLTDYIVGDAENIFGDSDSDDGLYRFPSGSIPANGYIYVAYEGDKFYDIHGFYPHYEIVDTLPNVPNMEKYDDDNFPGTWSLDDSGDEVLLIRDENGFLLIIDAVWYGSSTYLGNPVDISNVNDGESIERESFGLDAVYAGDVFVVRSTPTPIPESIIIGLIIVLLVIIFIYLKRK